MNNRASAFLTAIFLVALAAVLVFCIAFGFSNVGGTSEVASDYSEVSFAVSHESQHSSASTSVLPPVSTGNSGESTPPQDTVVHFLACPDNIIHSSVYYDALEIAARGDGVKPAYSSLSGAKYDFDKMYKNVAAEIAAADIAYINVETLIGGDQYGISAYPSFNTPEAVGEKLIDLGFDVFGLAHNHMLDSYDDRYLKGCNSFFTSRGKTTLGYFKDEADTENIKIYEYNGIKIAMLAYTYGTNGIKLNSSSTTVIPYLDEQLIRKQVAIAKSKADLVIVLPHWGVENDFNVNKSTYYGQNFASLFAELEVDMVIGMHPHVIQKMEYLTTPSGKKMFIAYSLGNFISGMHDSYNYVGGMLAFDIVKDGESGDISIQNILFKPVTTHSTRETSVDPKNDTGYRNMEICYIKDYTEEQAALHHCVRYEREHNAYTLIGPDNAIVNGHGTGKFTKDNLVRTVKHIIPEEFLEDYYKNYKFSE